MSTKRSGFRKSLPLITALTLILPLFLALAAPVSAATLCVKPGGAGGCHASIQAAVDAAGDGDTIYVYPGNYPEGVDLTLVAGDITLITVNNAGNPTPGTATVDNPDPAPEFSNTGSLDSNVTIDGFRLRSDYSAIDLDVDDGDVEIRNVDASGTGGDGIKVRAGAGKVTITDCTTNNNLGPGIYVWETGGDVTITNCTANQNVCPLVKLGEPERECEAHGIAVFGVGGKVTITDCTTNGNGGDGVNVGGSDFEASLAVEVIVDGGDVTIQNCTANGNDEDGFDVKGIPGTATIQACIARDNWDDGVELWGIGLQGVGLVDGVTSVNGSIICGNECGLGLWGPLFSLLNAEGNWWGCPGGPDGGAGCDPICQEDSLPVDFTPWIKSISGSATVDPVVAGEPTVLTFQFSGGPPPVYLGEGPGDRRGPAPFTVSTDNGTLDGKGATIGAFINQPDGVLKVTLVPQRAGTATVTVQGPCGLHAFITLGTWEFVPEPGSVVLLGTGLMGLAGYATLRWRSRQ